MVKPNKKKYIDYSIPQKERIEKLGKSEEFKYVLKYKNLNTGEILWKAHIPTLKFSSGYMQKEREAAKLVDLKFIENQKPAPNNILKRREE